MALVSRGGMCAAAVREGVFGLAWPAGRFLVACAKQIIDTSGLREEGSFKMASDGGSVRIKNW